MRKMRFLGAPFVLFAIVWVGIMGLVIVGLWNVLMPAIFGLHAISFWQALGLFVLSRVLFGRFLGGWGPRMHKMRFARSWKNLTPEERERFSRAMGPCRPQSSGQGEAPEKV
ncbi:MAG TPA: hypothetical protein VN841_00690 [Bryobacteraceae bacterium]|nr:hypothetical protein [Bryobacteraceae bacterium]